MKRHSQECSLISSEKGNPVLPCDAERPGIHSNAERWNEWMSEKREAREKMDIHSSVREYYSSLDAFGALPTGK